MRRIGLSLYCKFYKSCFFASEELSSKIQIFYFLGKRLFYISKRYISNLILNRDKIGGIYKLIPILFFVFLVFILNISNLEAREKTLARILSHYIKAGIAERLNQLDSAVREYKTALRGDYSSPYIHLRLAIVLLKQNELTRAIEELRLAIKYYDGLSDVSAQKSFLVETHTLLALVYSLQGDLDKATAEYETALQGALAIDPQNIRIHKSLAQVYLRKGELSNAERTYRFILDLSHNDAESHFFLGTIYEEQNKRKEAIEEFKKALKYKPEYPDALNSLGYIYAEESINLEEAEQMLRKALQYDPNNGAYIDSLGWIYFKQGEYDKAVQELERASRLLPDPVIYEHLGDAYFKQGDVDRARENWQKSLEVDSQKNIRIEKKLEESE